MSWEQLTDLLDVAVEREGSTVTVRLAGELDISSYPWARRAVEGAVDEATHVVVDMSRVTFCGVEGVTLLVAARKRAAARGVRFTLRYPNRSVCRVLELSRTRPAFGAAIDGWSPSPLPPDRRRVAAVAEALGEAREVTGTSMGTGQLWDTDCGVLRIVAHSGLTRGFLSFFETVFDDGESACATALGAPEPTFVADVATSAVFAGSPSRRVLLDEGVRSVAAVPVLSVDNSVIAVLATHHHEPVEWDDAQRRGLRKAAAGATVALSA